MYKKILLVTLLFLGIISPAIAVQTTYVPVSPLPGQGSDAVNIDDYIENLYQAVLALAVALAILKIMIGGLRRMFAGDNPTQNSESKADIQEAVKGLILALATIFILGLLNGSFKEIGKLGTLITDIGPITSDTTKLVCDPDTSVDRCGDPGAIPPGS